MISGDLLLQPILPWPLLALLAGLALAALSMGLWYGLRGTWWRAGAALALLAALADPSLRNETREPLKDIVLVVTDQSASQSLADRPAQNAAALSAVEAGLAALPDTEVRRITVGDAPDDEGSLVLTALARALTEEPRNRVAGAVLITDGQVHDEGLALDSPAPVNVLLTGKAADWDRRLKITTAPAFGIIGQEMKIGLRIDEQGAMPEAETGREVALSIAIDGGPAQTYQVPVNSDLELPLTLDHAGQNVVQFTLASTAGELTDRNNLAVVQINGVRDRLRVLLISGEPYAGERTWRNLLKSDSAVDLVHFTILRPPEKDDGVPVDELALIAFPTRELFVDKITEFDLIIFDRYPLRGLLPSEYLDNIRDYVLGGGAVLVAAGPEYASVESIYFSGVGDILPAAPTTRVTEGAFTPGLSDLGQRHPVTEGLDRPEGAPVPVAGATGAPPPWGRWMRYVDVADVRGQVLMEAPGGKPLLIVNREGEGRVALLASDQAWLWSRGFEGGGPQQELLRRLAHWMMKEPELEEEALSAAILGDKVTITRRTMTPGPREVTVTGPDGAGVKLPLDQERPGLYSTVWTPPAMGLYRMKEGDLERVFALGPASPREFDDAVASTTRLKAAITPTNGGFVRIEAGTPDVRIVRAGRPASGRGWIGITPRGAYRVADLRLEPLLPDWVWLALAAGLVLAGWIVEGRRRRAQPSGKV